MAVYWFSFTPNPADSAGLGPTFLNFIKFDGTTLAPPGITQTNTGTGIYQFNYTPSFSIAFRIFAATTGIDANYRYVVGNIDTSDELATSVQNQGSTLVAIGNTSIALGVTNVALGTTANALGTTTVASFAPVNTSLSSIISQNVTLTVGLSNQGVTLVGIGNTLTSGISGLGLSLSVLTGLIGDTASIYGGASLEPSTVFGYMKWSKEFLSGSQSFNKNTGTWNIFDRNFATLLIQKSVVNNVLGVTRF